MREVDLVVVFFSLRVKGRYHVVSLSSSFWGGLQHNMVNRVARKPGYKPWPYREHLSISQP